jgi:hypothetical protein
MAQSTSESLAPEINSFGGEPLEASGFEDEQPEDGFDDGGDDGND